MPLLKGKLHIFSFQNTYEFVHKFVRTYMSARFRKLIPKLVRTAKFIQHDDPARKSSQNSLNIVLADFG